MSSVDDITIFGAGGHARVAIDVFRAAGETVRACLGLSASDPIAGVPVLEEAQAIDELTSFAVARVFVAIGDNESRRRTANFARSLGFEVVSIVSPRAYVAPGVPIGSGSIVVHGAIINPGTTLGEDVIVNTAASVDHDNTIHDAVHIAPGSHLAGSVTVGAGAFVGAGSVVIPGLTIGDHSMVGAGSVVIRDVETGARVWGNPAREQKIDEK